MRRRLLFSEQRTRDALARLPPKGKQALRAALDTLREAGPDGAGLDVKALRGAGKGMFRLRVGDLRLAFRLRGRDIEVIHIFHRRQGYGWMERMR